jgi:nucleoside-diphosphate-sugar epimerase
VTSPEAVARAVEGVERIYHLAGLVSSKPGDAHRMAALHVDGTRLLSEAAARAGVSRIVIASTSGTVAVSRRADDVADEGTPAPVDIISRWPYYASKLYQEEAAKRACGAEVELVTVNPSLLLGPGDDRLSSTRPIVQFLAREILLMPAGGLNVVDARDVASLLPAAMARGARRALSGRRVQLDVPGFLAASSAYQGARPAPPRPGQRPRAVEAAAAGDPRPGRGFATGAAVRRWSRSRSRWPSTSVLDSGKAARELGFSSRRHRHPRHREVHPREPARQPGVHAPTGSSRPLSLTLSYGAWLAAARTPRSLAPPSKAGLRSPPGRGRAR